MTSSILEPLWRQLEYDFIGVPGADPMVIGLAGERLLTGRLTRHPSARSTQLCDFSNLSAWQTNCGRSLPE
jgi:hypothetical protein